MTSLELQEQIAVVEYCDLKRIPIVHITNEGKRSKAMGAMLKRAGLRKGFPDLFVPIPINSAHGLFIELKVGKNKPTPDQKEWISLLNCQGYVAKVCYGFDEAINTINTYLRG